MESQVMSQRTALVTGASGEMGRLLIPALARRGITTVVAMDLAPCRPSSRRTARKPLEGSVVDLAAMKGLLRTFPTDRTCSTWRRSSPARPRRTRTWPTRSTSRAPTVCSGSAAKPAGEWRAGARPLPQQHRRLRPARRRDQEPRRAPSRRRSGPSPRRCTAATSSTASWSALTSPTAHRSATWPALDFRAIRFPGLISAETLPTGGTTDYAPEMIHAAAQGKPYDCFVSEETRLPFMTMPDGVEALLQLAEADPAKLSTRVYNICGFSASAGEIRARGAASTSPAPRSASRRSRRDRRSSTPGPPTSTTAWPDATGVCDPRSRPGRGAGRLPDPRPPRALRPQYPLTPAAFEFSTGA